MAPNINWWGGGMIVQILIFKITIKIDTYEYYSVTTLILSWMNK